MVSMKEFKEKVAVITGAGSGIGLSIAERCSLEGMKVVLADIDKRFLRRATRKMEKLGASFLTIQTDVSKLSEMQILAEKTIERFELFIYSLIMQGFLIRNIFGITL